MSVRNRPRGNIIKEDLADELNLWNNIVEKIKRCHDINQKYEDLAAKIPGAEEGVPDDDPTTAISKLDELEKLHRECLKLSEQEQKILHEEPDDLIKNVDVLISVRHAFEADSPKAAIPATKPSRNSKRRLDADGATDSSGQTPDPASNNTGPTGRLIAKGTSRSGSVSAPSVKSEAALDSGDVKGVALDKKDKFVVGAEVFFRNKNKSSEGEGILCQITNVIGEGKQRRYEIQDTEPEPDENGQEPSPYRASVNSLVAIPSPSATLPVFPKGKQVFALYPNTNTFYKAEMVGMRKDLCRLRFEGEEERDKEMEVEKRYVLDVK